METSSGINSPFCVQHSLTCPVVDSKDSSFFMCCGNLLILILNIFKWKIHL